MAIIAYIWSMCLSTVVNTQQDHLQSSHLNSSGGSSENVVSKMPNNVFLPVPRLTEVVKCSVHCLCVLTSVNQIAAGARFINILAS